MDPALLCIHVPETVDHVGMYDAGGTANVLGFLRHKHYTTIRK